MSPRHSKSCVIALVLAEGTRREAKSAGLQARAAALGPGMRLDAWDPSAAVRCDRQLWNELTSLRFLDGPHGALILGPVGKTYLPPRSATSPSGNAAPSTWPPL